MGRFSQELREAIANKEPVFGLVELDLDGTTRRYSKSWVGSDSLGQYKAQVVSFGQATQSVGLKQSSLQAFVTSVTIADDRDRTLHKLMETCQTIRGSAARLKVVSPAIDADKYYTAFTGLTEPPTQVKPGQWQFNLRPNDKPLRGQIRSPLITVEDWPDAQDGLGERAPLVFGTHESSGLDGAAGMVSTLLVDDSGNRHLISAGTLNALNDAFSNASPITASHYGSGVTTVDINGRTYSLADFDRSDYDDTTVTVDVEGLSSGEENPAEQLRLLLCNWVFDEYTSGTLATTNAYVDESKFDAAAAFFDRHNIAGAMVIPGSWTGEQACNSWMSTFRMPVYWTHEGKLGVGVDEYGIDDVYFDWPYLTEIHCLSEPKYDYSTELLADEIRADYMYGQADSKFWRAVRVKDTRWGYDVAEPLQLTWGSSDPT